MYQIYQKLFGKLMIAYFRHGFSGFQVYAAHVDNVGRKRSRGLGGEMTIQKDDEWVVVLSQIIRSRIC